MTNIIKKIEADLQAEYDAEKLPPEEIISYNELRSCADLFRLKQNGTLDIQPDFQREIIWSEADQTRFIDSLSKQLPIPSMCFSLDNKTQEWKVVDGLQRMATIIKFLEGKWKLSRLDDVNKEICGKTAEELKKSQPVIFSRIENMSLPVTILRCDYEKKDHLEYIFIIFRRLNEGGMKLNNQEIRNAVYQGSFNSLLKELNQQNSWLSLIGLKNTSKDRFRKVELILRFFAFYSDLQKYNGKLAQFLNNYMFENRNLNETEQEKKKKLFDNVVGALNDAFKDKRGIKGSSNVVLESLMFGVAANLPKLKNTNSIPNLFKEMLANENFNEENIREGIYKKDKVKARLEFAKKIFGR